MRFCPFCAQENADAASECAHCGRKLPQLTTPQHTSAGFPAVRPVTPPPRRLPRAFPRTRPVTPLPASEAPVAAPEAPAPIEAHGSARARSGTLLGIPAADTGPIDLPTDQNIRVPPEEVSAEVTTPSARIDVDPPEAFEGSTVPAIAHAKQAAEFTAPIDTQVQIQSMRHVPAPPPPVPAPAPPLLPPPPLVTAPLRVDPDEELPLVPVAESQPVTISRGVPADVPEPVPMPQHPGPGVLAAVKYLLPLAKAVWARHKAQEQLRALLHDDQRHVDEALRDLGDAAWQMRPRPPELRGELDRADEDDARRRGAEQELARLDMSVTAEKERFAVDAQQREAAIGKREAEVARVAEDLAERRRAQKTEEKALRDVEARLRAAEKQVQQHEAAAYKAQQTPPEKGGGANAAANLREQAVEAQREVDGIKPDVDAQAARVRALDAPIAELDASHTAERGALAAEKSALEAARRAHADELAKLEVARRMQIETREVAERAVRLRLVSTGTLLSLHRLDAKAHQPTFAPIYARLDELQGVASARDARIGTLEAERHGYDRAALQRGLIAVGGAVGAFAILLVVIIVVLARH